MPRQLSVFFPPPPPPRLLKTLRDAVAETLAQTHNNGGDASSSSKHLNPSILVIILILAVVTIVSASLHLLLRYLNRYCGSSSNDVVPSMEPQRVHQLSSRRVSPEDQTLIDSLPLFSFNSVAGPRRSGADCAVCLSKFKPDDQLRLLPICCHAFHSRCIDTWLASNYTCPLCRSTIHVVESDGSVKLSTSSAGGDSFRLEIGSVSHRRNASDSGEVRRTYSMGSFDYVVDEESEIVVGPAHRRGVSDCSIGGKVKDGVTSSDNFPATEPSGSEALAEVAGSRGWLKEYVERLVSTASSSFSSRALSFRLSGAIFTGSSRRSDGFAGSSRRSDVGIAGIGGGSWDLEGNRIGEEISSYFRWLSGI